MGRYTSVQAYADNNANVRSIPYDQATGADKIKDDKDGSGKEIKPGAVTTEKVSNPYGSTAGAGSGEFHVYRHARAREAARWKALDASEQQALEQQQFQEQVKLTHNEEAEKTARRRKKRQREKEAKQRKKHLKAAGISTTVEDDSKNAGDGEFTYIPEKDQQDKKDAASEDTPNDDSSAEDPTKKSSDSAAASATSPMEDIPNDGSFLELMKKKLEAEQRGKQKNGQANDEDQDEGPIMPPPAKRMAIIESRIIDEDDEEGPMPLPKY
jgi:hypothetical protein